MEILELGCGWGSLTLWMAEKFPNARVTAISNSNSQREFIQARAAERGLSVDVRTIDVQELALDRRFDRVVSVEMFEHVRNHAALLDRVARHLEPGGALFVHVFAHRSHGYEFEDTWMTRRFFQGGVMPVHGWLGHLENPALVPVEEWWLNGNHYAKTAHAWLENFDANKAELHEIFSRENGPGQAAAEVRAWRLLLHCLPGDLRRGRWRGVRRVAHAAANCPGVGSSAWSALTWWSSERVWPAARSRPRSPARASGSWCWTR